jgi:hypothetical protein
MSPETQAFLDQIRDAEDPPPEAEQRVLSALNATVVAGGVAGAHGLSKLLEPLSSWGISGLKLGTVVLCAVAVIETADSPGTELGAKRAVAVVQRAPHEAAPAQARSEPSRPLPTPLKLERPAQQAAKATKRERVQVQSLREELALLVDVRAALQRGDGHAALALLDGHDTSDRQLLEERTAARVLALCAAGRVDEAREAAAAFARRYPSSLQLVAVARACTSEH